MEAINLSTRQQVILRAIVENYIRTGEPVGSKLLSAQLDIASPATIRSDMAWLFEMGYLEQPHTSAGRVPSHLGYREYIDSLMKCRPLSDEERMEIDSLFNVHNPDPDRLLEDAAEALSAYTNCATITSSVAPRTVGVRKVELVAAGRSTVVVLVIATNGAVRSKVCRVDFVITPELLDFFIKFANSRLQGLSVDTISGSYINSVSVTLGEYSRIFTPLLSAIFELCKEINDGQYYISGETNLVESGDPRCLSRELLIMLDRRDFLQSMFRGEQEELRIRIGKENAVMELSGSTVVVSPYSVGGEQAGIVGLIGPIRIDYAKIIPHLRYFTDTLGELLSETLEKE